MMNCQRLNWMTPKGGEAIPPRIALYLNFLRVRMLLIEELYIRSAFLFSGTNIMANKTIGDEGITVDFRFIKVHTSN